MADWGFRIGSKVSIHFFLEFNMIRVVILDQERKVVSPNELTSAAKLREAASTPRELAADCERLANLKEPPVPVKQKQGIPYLS
jgi:hypothetical protein